MNIVNGKDIQDDTMAVYRPFLNQPVSSFIRGPGPEIIYERQDGHMVFVGGD